MDVVERCGDCESEDAHSDEDSFLTALVSVVWVQVIAMASVACACAVAKTVVPS